MSLFFTFVVGAIVILLLMAFKVFRLWFSSQDTKSYLQAKAITEKVVAIDCEMVACVPNEEWKKKARKCNNKKVKVAVRCAIVDSDLKVLYNEYIRPPMEVEDWEDFNYKEKVMNGMPFVEARANILALLTDKIVVAYDFHHDFDALQIDDDIPSEKVQDMYHYGFSLKGRTKDILGRNIQRKKPHDPVEDARAAMDLYKEVEQKVEQEWEEQ